ncbi:AAA family ATPase [Deinococcus puniceus]|uniref:Chromosome segregation protein SMC n=1 Tax=Deinococcus puniceus TaxID=1182568 RepID=A0A172TAL2_9DEIO|nr:SMC family ATPase [Deinococcus puniceus]ANE44059.1 chromosome segregation protein SMC [Deinococcus puniceus]
MRPIHLELQGFTAFRQFTELNFDDLELFALVGPTGSGKSSLLDAMTFALYGSTARLGASGLDALISQGERGLSVSLTFEVGGQVYRAARTKGRKQAENDVRLERQDDDGRWTGLNDGGTKGINERIRRAVGLDFKTFARSVMLPQGEFARLLHGNGKERQMLLGELTGLDHVQAMQKVASDKAKELKYRADSDQKVLANEYGGVTAEAVAALHTERERLSAEAERLTDTLETLRARQTRLRDTERVWLAREDTRRRLTTLQARTGSILDGAQRAAQARRVAGVEPLLDAAGRARIAHEREAATLARAASQAEVVARAVHTAQTTLDAAQKAETTIPELEARAEALREAENDVARLRRAGGTVQTTHQSPLPWDEDAHHAARELAQKLDKLKAERVQIEAQKAALHADRERQNTETAQLKNLTDEQERVKREGQEAKTASERADAALKTAQIEAGAAAYRTHLHAGEPCPLCLQQVEHVPPASNLDLVKLEQEASALKTNLEGRRLRYKEIGLELATLRKSVDARTDALRDWEAQIGQREVDLRELESHIPGDPHTDALRLLAGLALRVREAGADPAKLRKQALDGVAAIRKRVQDAAAALANAASAAAGAQATLQGAQAAAATRAREMQEAQSALDSALTVLGLDAAQARAAALPEADIAALEEAARTHTAQVSQLSENLKELERQLGVAPFDPAELGQVTRDLTATDAALTAARELAGQLREQERTAKERLQRKAEIEGRAALLAAQHDTWKTLTTSLRADEFQQFLLAEVEAQLLTRAGILLHSISDGRYRLALADGEYVVQDLWNAGEARGVKTLSGGETFLASLSLAIALSDYLAGNKILGALFLDEGFGTLDPQALEAVAGALENLRTQGRMVGVVTHVESLSERLPSRLLVTKSVAGSSVQRF